MKRNSDPREIGYHSREHDEDPTCHRTNDTDTPCEPVEPVSETTRYIGTLKETYGNPKTN